MKKTNQGPTDQCVLCGSEETFEHMLRCKHSNRIKWKQQMISNLRNIMSTYATNERLSDTFNSALTEWLDYGEVDHHKYPDSHQQALYSQWKIGWFHVFTGHISQEWENLQGDTELRGRPFKASDWASSVVTSIMQSVILLWEQRNSEVHGTSFSEQSNRLLDRHRQTISKMLALKAKCRSRDHFLFPSNPETLLNETSTTKLANWIASRTQVIKNSIAEALKHDVQHTRSITTWFASSNPTPRPQDQQWHTRLRLLHDPFNKKKRHKNQSPDTRPKHSSIQTLLTHHFN